MLQLDYENALTLVGDLMEIANQEYQKLPNEFTKGQHAGISRVYNHLINNISNKTNIRDHLEEEIPFTTPPVNPQTGQMQKYGKTPPSPNPPYAPMIHELQEIKIVLMSIYDVLTENKDKTEENFGTPFIKEKPEDPRLKKYDKNFGQRMMGNPTNTTNWNQEEDQETHYDPGFQTNLSKEDIDNWKGAFYDTSEQEVYDPETGEEGKQRVIGKMSIDDDSKTVEEWEYTGTEPSGPYVSRDSGNELQDLGPGEV